MLSPKKKISKRELKQDTLITSYVKATDFYERNKRNISIGVTAAIVLILAVVFYINNRSASNQQASTQLGAVFALYDAGQYQQAIDGVPAQGIRGLKDIVDNYGSTHAGDIARFYLANAYYQLGKYDDALTQFKDFSALDDVLEVSRLSGIAACYEAKGMYKDAAENYDKAGTKYPKDINAAENLSNAARDYGKAGEKATAIELYKKLKQNYPTSASAREADRFIAALSV